MTPPCERHGCGEPSIWRVPVCRVGDTAYRIPTEVEPVCGEVALCALHEGELAVNGEVPVKHAMVTA